MASKRAREGASPRSEERPGKRKGAEGAEGVDSEAAQLGEGTDVLARVLAKLGGAGLIPDERILRSTAADLAETEFDRGVVAFKGADCKVVYEEEAACPRAFGI